MTSGILDTSTVIPSLVLADCGLDLSRADLLWSLHLLVDERGLDDGDAYRLPATAAAAMDRDTLDGLSPVLEAILDEVDDSSRTADQRPQSHDRFDDRDSADDGRPFAVSLDGARPARRRRRAGRLTLR